MSVSSNPFGLIDLFAMALAIIKDETGHLKALRLGIKKGCGGIEPAGEEHDGFFHNLMIDPTDHCGSWLVPREPIFKKHKPRDTSHERRVTDNTSHWLYRIPKLELASLEEAGIPSRIPQRYTLRGFPLWD